MSDPAPFGLAGRLRQAREALRLGYSLKTAAARVGMTPEALDVALWQSLAGLPLEAKP